jgi:uncharacterized membrane protein YvbJ
MKKINKKKDKDCLLCNKAGDFFKKTKEELNKKMGEGRRYAEKNPQKSKAIMAGLGAFLLLVVSFFIGKKRGNKNKENEKK